MNEEKRKKIILYCAITTVALTMLTILVGIFKPQIQSFLEKDKLEAFIICENWEIPSCVESEVKSLNIAQIAGVNQTNIKNILKAKSMDHLLIYNKGENPDDVLYITILDSEYTEVIKKGKVIDEIKGEVFYEQLEPLLIGDDVQVRTWRKCCAKREDSESGVSIHRSGNRPPPKISFFTPPVVDFDNWLKILVK